MASLLLPLALLCAVTALAVILVGIVWMTPERKNRLMRWRIVFQLLAIILIAMVSLQGRP